MPINSFVEEVVYALLSKLKSGPKSREELLETKLKGWSKEEFANILDTMVQTSLVEGDSKLEITKKGKFFWKRVHRKNQGFLG